MVVCSNRYKSDWHMEQLRCQELCDEIKRLKDQLDHMNKLSRMDQATMAELRTVIGKFFFSILLHYNPSYTIYIYRRKRMDAKGRRAIT